MRTRYIAAFVILVQSLCLSQIATISPDTGTPPFQSFGGGPEAINLGSLNIHYSIPIFSRAGRGIPFSYGLAYDSSVWEISGSAWAPVSTNWGLTKDVGSVVGVVYYSARQVPGCDGTGAISYTFKSYADSAGSSHPINKTVIDNPNCNNSSAQTIADDDSGITITVDATPSATVTLRSGQKITPILSTGGASDGSATDNNGNQITTSTTGSVTKLFDTLSSTTPVLTIDKTNPVSVLYKYTNPANTTAQVTVTYVTYSVQTKFLCSGINDYGPISNSLVDRITLPDGSFYQFTYEATPGVTGKVTGRLASVKLPTGGTISYTYTGSNAGMNCADGSTWELHRATPDNPSPSPTWDYVRTVSNGIYSTNMTDPAGNLTVLTFQVPASDPGTYYETNRVVKDSSGTELETIQTCYNANCAAAVTTPITQLNIYRSLAGINSTTTTQTYNGYGLLTTDYEYLWDRSTSSWKQQSEKAITYNTTLTNNIVDHPSMIRIFGTESVTLKGQTTYVYDEGTVTTTNGTPNHNPVTGSRGNVTTINSFISSSASLSRHLTYYDTGTVNTATDVNGAVTTNTYGTGSCGNSFVTSVSLPLSLSRSMVWNCTGGVLKQVTDENGQISKVNYTTDTSFWRPESTQDQLGNVTTLTYTGLTQSEAAMPVNGTTSSADVVTTLDSLGRSFLTQRRQSPTSSSYDSVEQHYGTTGLPNWASVAYVAAKGAIAPGGTTTNSPTFDNLGRLTQMVYGNGSGGTTNYSYPNLNDAYQEVTPAPTNENTKKKQLEYDSLGRLTSVCEITTASGSGACGQLSPQTGFLTKYVYDSPVNSMQVTENAQPGGTAQNRTYQDDFLGRLTSEANPESGTTQYFYDSAPSTPGVACPSGTGSSNGDLVKEYDAQGNTTCYGYDALHRVITVKYPAGPNSASTPEKHFVYDGATVNGVVLSNAKGRLAEAYTGTSASKITDLGFNYDAGGQVVNYYESTPHSSGYYTLCVGIWPHGAIKSLNCIPGIPMLNYGAGGTGLDGEGRVTQVSAQSGQNPVSAVTYATSGTTQPIGAITHVTYGSTDADDFSYSPNTGALNSYVFHAGSQTVTGNLTLNTNGSLKQLQITDQLNAANTQTCTYLYDDLGRVGLPPGSTGKSVDCGATKWQQNFSFDPFGNITKTVPTGGTGVSFTPTYSTSTNRYSSLPGFTPTYDANGDLTADGTHSFAWDVEGHPVTVDTAALTYDALGRMVEQGRSGSYTQIVYGPTGKFALMNGQTLAKGFAPLPGGGTAVYTPNVLPAYYRHSDWLGSSRLATTPGSPPTNHLYYDGAYAPFGENYAGTGTTDLDFTGQNQDTVSGLYDFMFREYSAAQGRWMSPDPAGLGAVDPANPQSWNRYAYVGNSPTIALDLLGLQRAGCHTNAVCVDNYGGADLGNPFGAFDSFAAIDGIFTYRDCFWGGTPAACSAVDGTISLGFAAACNANCGTKRLVVSTPGVNIVQQWIPGTTTPIYTAFNKDTQHDEFTIGATAGFWQDVGFVALGSNGLQETTLVAANDSQPEQQVVQGKHWPYKGPASCSAYGAGGPLNFVCRNAGTTRYANSARGCLQTYWDAKTGSYSMTPGGPGAPNQAFLPVPSFISFVNSHAICLVGALVF